MRILQIAPPWFAVPPTHYGGIESVVAELTNGLVDCGHDVTLHASGGSRTKGRLCSVSETPPSAQIESAHHALLHSLSAYKNRHDFDVIHDHAGFVSSSIASMIEGPPVVHTLHGPWRREAHELYGMLPPRLHLVAISHDQASRAPRGIRHAGVVHNGIAVEHYPLRSQPRGTQGYLCFIGRASQDKGPATAIRIARGHGCHLKMMIKISEPEEQAYWRTRCQPLLADADVEIRTSGSRQIKAQLLAWADATLFPIQWDEPFGLVMVESMACGTPVIAYRRGAAPEVLVDETTGFLVEPQDADAFATAVTRAGEIEPAACRAHVERYFSTRSMLRGYIEIYADLAAGAAEYQGGSGRRRQSPVVRTHDELAS